MGGALFGQGLNFLAMLLPILGGETGQLAYLMVPLSLGTILSRSSILAFHARYLTLPDRKRGVATSVSAAMLMVTTVTTLVVAGVVYLVAPSSGVAGVIAWAGYITFTNGIYFMAVAVATQEKAMATYSRARFWYGVANILLTAVVVFLLPFRSGLVVVAGLTTLLGAAIILPRTANSVIGPLYTGRAALLDHDHRAYLRESGGATAGTFLGELGFQLQGLLTPLFGQYQELWASVVRITGGFGSLAQQVVAPGMEARIAGSIRAGDEKTTRRLCIRALGGGLAFSILCAVALLASLTVALRGHDSFTTTSLTLAALYCIAVLSTSLSLKVPLMKRRVKAYTLLSTLRLIALCSLLLTSGLATFACITVLQSILSAFSATISLSKAANE